MHEVGRTGPLGSRSNCSWSRVRMALRDGRGRCLNLDEKVLFLPAFEKENTSRQFALALLRSSPSVSRMYGVPMQSPDERHVNQAAEQLPSSPPEIAGRLLHQCILPACTHGDYGAATALHRWALNANPASARAALSNNNVPPLLLQVAMQHSPKLVRFSLVVLLISLALFEHDYCDALRSWRQREARHPRRHLAESLVNGSSNTAYGAAWTSWAARTRR